MDFIKRFFGLYDENERFNGTFRQQDQNDNEDEGNRNRTNFKFPDPDNDVQRPSFHIFSDPLHMHQYFEYQMNEMLKTFGFQGFDNDFANVYSNIPTLQEEFEFSKQESSKDLRDQFLKNGYEKPSQKQSENTDKDIDGRVQLGDLDSIFGRTNSKNSFENEPEGFFFGQSTSIKTIRNPDGSVETHRTVRDNEGNEETTVCRKIGDKEYCISKKRDKYGKEEIIENLVNMDDKEKSTVFKYDDKLPIQEDIPQHYFPFNKFFK